MRLKNAAMLALGIAMGAGAMAMTAACVPDPEPTQSDAPTAPSGAIQEYDTRTLECGVNATVASDTDGYGNNWAYCEPKP